MSEWLIKLFRQLLAAVSGPLREQLESFARKFREDARQTSNPMDDILADILCWLLGIE